MTSRAVAGGRGERIRARAIRRAGELLNQIERPEQGGRPQNGMADRTVSSAARDAGMSGPSRA